LDKWCKDKHPLIRLMARWLVAEVEKVAEVLKYVREGKLAAAFPNPPNGAEWVKLYRNHRRVQEVMEGFLPEDKESEARLGRRLGELEKAIEKLKSMQPRDWDAWWKGLGRAGRARILVSTRAITRALEEFDFNRIEVDEEDFEKGVVRPEVVFMVLVWMPCWMLYGEFPTHLMRRARQGDPDALEDLLRLDRWALRDEKVWAEWQRTALKPKGGEFKRLMRALRQGSRKHLTDWDVRVLFAALLGKISDLLALATKGWGPRLRAKRLTPLQLRGLFDAVAKDAGKMVDEEIGDNLDRFRKAVERHKEFWKFLPETGQKQVAESS